MIVQTFYWTPWAFAGLVAWLAAWTAAVFIYKTAPDPRIRRRFSALLFLEGVLALTSAAGPLLWVGSGRLVQIGYTFHVMNDWLVLAAYLPAVAVAIESPLLQPFRTGWGFVGALVLGVGGAMLVALRPEFFITDVTAVVPPRFGSPYYPVNTIGSQIGWTLLTISYTYGCIATVLAWFRAQAPLARRRAGALSWAFGTRDLALGGVFLYLGLNIQPPSVENLLVAIQFGMWAILVYVMLTAYGIATVHLFDIDIRLKWTLEKGTAAAVFVAVFYVVSEGTATLLSEQLGTFFGIMATGGLVFALAPLQRAIERLSSAAMPDVADTPEYRAFRKEQIYGEALAEALKDGGVTPVERAILDRLRTTLELDENVARNLEDALTASASNGELEQV